MRFDRLQKIFRAGRLKPASGAWTTDRHQERREGKLISSNTNANQGAHQALRIEARPARRNHSPSNSRYVAFAAETRATITIHVPATIWFWCLRTTSRRRRRTRLRTTALPIVREVTKPARNPGPSARRKPRIRKFPRSTRPCFLTRSNSAGLVNRRVLGNVKRCGALMILF